MYIYTYDIAVSKGNAPKEVCMHARVACPRVRPYQSGWEAIPPSVAAIPGGQAQSSQGFPRLGQAEPGRPAQAKPGLAQAAA